MWLAIDTYLLRRTAGKMQCLQSEDEVVNTSLSLHLSVVVTSVAAFHPTNGSGGRYQVPGTRRSSFQLAL